MYVDASSEVDSGNTEMTPDARGGITGCAARITNPLIVSWANHKFGMIPNMFRSADAAGRAENAWSVIRA
jgi:hypothetical protein